MLVNALSLMALWSTSFPLQKAVLEVSSLAFFSLTRAWIAFCCFFPLIEKLKWSRTLLLSLFGYGVVGMYLANVLELEGLKRVSAGEVCLLYSFSPFISALLSFLHLGESFSLRKGVGILLGVSCTWMGAIHLDQGLSLAQVYMFLAVIASSYGWLCLRYLTAYCSISPTTANAWGMLIGGVCFLFHSLWVDAWSPLPVKEVQPFVLLVLSVTLISNIICHVWCGYLLRVRTATFLSFVGLMCPFFVSVIQALVQGIAFTPSILVTIPLLFFSLWIVQGEEVCFSKGR